MSFNENCEQAIADPEENQEQCEPLAVFGVITDIQYANVDDHKSYDRDYIRYYRNSLNLVKEAVNDWKNSTIKIKFVIQLGDFVDGKAKHINDSEPSVNCVLNEFKKLFDDDEERMKSELLHIWGNHEFYNFLRSDLMNLPLNTAKSLRQDADKQGNYYSYPVTDHLTLICLDCYEFSIIGYTADHPIYKEAHDLLRKHNTNEDLNNTSGLRGHAKRFSMFNGSLSESQMKWLERQLIECKEKNKKVIVCGHVPIHPQAVDLRCLMWDQKEILELLGLFEKTVIAYFSGHDHRGGYFRDKHNIHHISFPAIIETTPNSNAYATVKVYDNKVSVEGVGKIGYYECYF